MINFEKVCRTCGKEGKELLFLFKNEEIPTLLMEIAPINVAENDGFPSRICKECVNQMYAAVSFKNQCMEANKKFLSYLKIDNLSIKSEQPLEENVTNTNNYSLRYIEDHIKSKIFTDNLKPFVCKEESNDSREDCNESVEIESIHYDIILQEVKTEDNEERIKEKPFQCHICGMRLSNRFNADRHLQIHSVVKSYICEFCGKQFIRHPALVLHLKSHENSLKIKQNRQKLKRSEINNENRERPFKCDVCDKRFVRKGGLQWHQIKHGEKKFVCPECGKAFSHKMNLELHWRVHTGERPFECPECKKCFKQEVALMRHRRIHTGEKPFACQVCGKRFSQGPHLKRHMLIHKGEKPYQCIFCDRRFIENQNLKVHTRIHTGEKPYVCSVCNQGFYDSSMLKKHKIKKKHC